MPQPRSAPAPSATYPDNPVLVRVRRGDWIESQHRGAWVLVDDAGSVLAGDGAVHGPVFARSSIKSIQALPLVESGAVERFGLTEAELALALSSHGGEPCHTEGVGGWLARLGLDPAALRCGAHAPFDAKARVELARRGEKPSALHNNCSGKHTGFLCLSLQLGAPLERYLDPAGPVQRAVRSTLEELSGAAADEIDVATDGCSAPTFRLPLSKLATAVARVANPEGLAPTRRAACERLLAAASRHPELVAATKKRLCTDLLRVTGGRLFPKIGGDAVYVIGVRGARRGLAVKVDDGESRGLPPLVVALCERFGFLTGDEARELARLGDWPAGASRNWAGLEVGRVEVLA